MQRLGNFYSFFGIGIPDERKRDGENAQQWRINVRFHFALIRNIWCILFFFQANLIRFPLFVCVFENRLMKGGILTYNLSPLFKIYAFYYWNSKQKFSAFYLSVFFFMAIEVVHYLLNIYLGHFICGGFFSA